MMYHMVDQKSVCSDCGHAQAVETMAVFLLVAVLLVLMVLA